MLGKSRYYVSVSLLLSAAEETSCSACKYLCMHSCLVNSFVICSPMGHHIAQHRMECEWHHMGSGTVSARMMSLVLCILEDSIHLLPFYTYQSRLLSILQNFQTTLRSWIFSLHSRKGEEKKIFHLRRKQIIEVWPERTKQGHLFDIL